MIGIRQEGRNIIINVTGGHPISAVSYDFEWNAGCTQYAQLLTHNFNSEITHLIEGIRGAAYNEGWKDKRLGITKKRTFYPSLSIETNNGH